MYFEVVERLGLQALASHYQWPMRRERKSKVSQDGPLGLLKGCFP